MGGEKYLQIDSAGMASCKFQDPRRAWWRAGLSRGPLGGKASSVRHPHPQLSLTLPSLGAPQEPPKVPCLRPTPTPCGGSEAEL